MAYLMRVVLPDRPGMLGAVATAIGQVGGDIVSLDVVERGPSGAVDDLLVQLPVGGLADALITSAQSVPGVVVESLMPYFGADDLHRDLELVDELATEPGDTMDLLVDGVVGVFRASWAALVQQVPGSEAPGGLCLLRATAGAPEVVGPAGWLPMLIARRLVVTDDALPGSWEAIGMEVAAAPVGDPGRVLLVGRTGGPRWLDGEVARLAHLAGIAHTVAAAQSVLAEPLPAARPAPVRASAL